MLVRGAGRFVSVASRRPTQAFHGLAAGSRFFASAPPATTAGSSLTAPGAGASAIQFHPGTLGGIDTPAAAAAETPKQMVMRWVDVGGLLTRTYSRRAWIMDFDSHARAREVMATEYERWLYNFLLWANLILFPMSLWYWFGEMTHMSCKPPNPLPEQQWGRGNFKVEYDFLPFTSVVEHHFCKKCRWLEYECKKMCYDEMREVGFHKWGLDRPKTQTAGFH